MLIDKILFLRNAERMMECLDINKKYSKLIKQRAQEVLVNELIDFLNHINSSIHSRLSFPNISRRNLKIIGVDSADNDYISLVVTLGPFEDVNTEIRFKEKFLVKIPWEVLEGSPFKLNIEEYEEFCSRGIEDKYIVAELTKEFSGVSKPLSCK